MTMKVGSAFFAAVIAFAACATTAAGAKQCYAPDERSQARGFSRAVTTEGGKTLWLGGETGTPGAAFDAQVREIFAGLDKTIKANGGAGLADMVTMTVFITDARLGAVVARGERYAENAAPPDTPPGTVKGEVYAPGSILARNMGREADQTTQFPPHKIVGNIYYVGTKTLSSFLIVTPQGNILLDSTYERNVPVIQKSVEQLGFKFSDVKILLGNHAHGDHQEGDALVKQMTGAQVIAMAEDVPALQPMKPGGKDHPIDT